MRWLRGDPLRVDNRFRSLKPMEMRSDSRAHDGCPVNKMWSAPQQCVQPVHGPVWQPGMKEPRCARPRLGQLRRDSGIQHRGKPLNRIDQEDVKRDPLVRCGPLGRGEQYRR